MPGCCVLMFDQGSCFGWPCRARRFYYSDYQKEIHLLFHPIHTKNYELLRFQTAGFPASIQSFFHARAGDGSRFCNIQVYRPTWHRSHRRRDGPEIPVFEPRRRSAGRRPGRAGHVGRTQYGSGIYVDPNPRSGHSTDASKMVHNSDANETVTRI